MGARTELRHLIQVLEARRELLSDDEPSLYEGLKGTRSM